MGGDARERRAAGGRARNRAKSTPAEPPRPLPPRSRGPQLCAGLAVQRSLRVCWCRAPPPRKPASSKSRATFLRGITAEMSDPPALADTQRRAALATLHRSVGASEKWGRGSLCRTRPEAAPSLRHLLKPPPVRLTLHQHQMGAAPPKPETSAHPPSTSASSPTARVGRCDSSREGGRRPTRVPCQGRGEGRSWAARSRWSSPAPLPGASSARRGTAPRPWAALQHPLAHSQEVRKQGQSDGVFPRQGSLFLLAFRPFVSGEKQGSKILLIIMKSVGKKKK